ncbi:hypothetical protein PF005_g3627 [Phytophthora fragariae]|uniref:Uncharacterized protein n=1 Tax=Phytophthora fragariae TaxID=53985 RepID=A0A6A3FJE5_9STRA|nr:hypothetical protein PF003_g21485 [Phytophthora fragariae]KAE8944477.1 hypothetical protein PF009_g5855 [Phytophthora fragariae]KAE9132702.1 hypothetical protein PF007_g3634 [Phytophthora fragariae]KAE9152741.1 hypothetical protein PF006_g3081 [Phytophthora fragariae]KAE9230098.1 hypothetical protein PF005_g3627 [Phytophthora fragariae]
MRSTTLLAAVTSVARRHSRRVRETSTCRTRTSGCGNGHAPAKRASASSQPRRRRLPVPQDARHSVSMVCIFDFRRATHCRTGVVIFVDRFSKLVHLAPVAPTITATQTGVIFVEIGW